MGVDELYDEQEDCEVVYSARFIAKGRFIPKWKFLTKTNPRESARMRIIILFGILFFVSSTILAHEIDQPHVAVYGTSTIEVKPNVMLWGLVVESKGVDLNKVSKAHSKTVKSVLGVIKENAIEKSSLQTSNMNFGENKVYRNDSLIKEGYRASTTLSFKLKDFDGYEPLWQALSKIKGVSIDGIRYDHSDRISLRNRARKKALLVAKDKANSLADIMEMGIGETIVISEVENPYSRSRESNFAEIVRGVDGSGSAGISPGTISITMKMKLIMGLVPR